MTSYTSAFDSGFLARFTAAVASTAPEFDPELNPIGHALAAEMFAREEPELAVAPQVTAWPQRPAVDAAEPAVAAGTSTERPASVVIELPLATESPVGWWDATIEPDDEIGGPIDRSLDQEQVRRAS